MKLRELMRRLVPLGLNGIRMIPAAPIGKKFPPLVLKRPASDRKSGAAARRKSSNSKDRKESKDAGEPGGEVHDNDKDTASLPSTVDQAVRRGLSKGLDDQEGVDLWMEGAKCDPKIF